MNSTPKKIRKIKQRKKQKMVKNNILKQIGLFGAGLLLSANMNAQQLHGTVKLASDGVTPVENANIKIWHKYTTGSVADTLHLTIEVLILLHFLLMILECMSNRMLCLLK